MKFITGLTAILLPLLTIYAQTNKTITGRIVTSTTQEPVEGVTLMLLSSKTSATTTASGSFVLPIKTGSDTILVTHVGYETKRIAVDGNTASPLIIMLAKTAAQLDDVTVSTGYQTIPKERATGSFVQVDNELVNRRVSTNIIDRLEGIASGILFYRSNNSNALFSIRGNSTIAGNTQPLIVIDNFPYDGDLNNINPNDVESITILKDAAAASIWGVRSGNGVIVITTKRGRYNQRLKVEFNSNVTISSKPDLFYSPSFLTSTDFIDVEKFLFNKGYYDGDINNTTTRPPLSPVVEILVKQRAGQLSSTEAEAQINNFRSIDIRNDLSKYFYRKSIRQQNALNISGGSAKANYLLSVGYDNNLLTEVQNQYNRITINSANTFIPVKNLEISARIVYTQSNTESDNTLSQIMTGGPTNRSIYPYAQLADEQGNSLAIVKDYRTSFVQDAETRRLLNWQFNPLNELGLTDYNTKLYDTRLNAAIRYTFVKGLSSEVKYQYEKGITQSKQVKSQETYFTRNFINRYAIINTNGTVTNNLPLGGIADFSNSNLTSNSTRWQIDYNNNNEKHSIAAIGGIDIREVKVSGNSNRLFGYDPLNLTFRSVNFDTSYRLNPTGTSRIPDQSSLTETIDRFRSAFVNAVYAYKSRYTFSASGRIDQSNLFGVKSNQRSVPLWSAGVKWNIHKEVYYKSALFPSLVLRATYGYNGNLNKSVTAYTVARYLSGASYTGLPYGIIQTPGNPELRWEKTGMVNVALDFTLKNKLLSGSIEYYHKKGVDMIGAAPLASSTGFTSAIGNFSNMAGKGIDVTLNSDIVNKKFKWNTIVLLSFASDKVTRYNNNTGFSTIIEGRPVYSLFSYRWAGLDPATGDPLTYLSDTISKNYSATINLKTADMVFSGSAVPQIFGSFRNTLSWKQISFSFNIVYKAKYYCRRNTIAYNSLFSTWSGHTDYTKRWQKRGDEAFTTVPSMIYPANTSRDYFYANSEATIEKGDHVRLQDIDLRYDLNKKVWAKLPFENVQIYMYLNNVGLLWKASIQNIDPDFQTGYPSPRTISIGLRVSF